MELQLQGLRVDAKGEGSRGGHVIGHTSSGKPIYENHKHPSHEKFRAGDHDTARKLHEELSDKFSEQSRVVGGDKQLDEKANQHHASAKHHREEGDFKHSKRNFSPKELKAAGLTSVGGRK